MNIWMKFSDSGSKSKQSDYDIILLGLVISANQCLLGKQTLCSSIICYYTICSKRKNHQETSTKLFEINLIFIE